MFEKKMVPGQKAFCLRQLEGKVITFVGKKKIIIPNYQEAPYVTADKKEIDVLSKIDGVVERNTISRQDVFDMTQSAKFVLSKDRVKELMDSVKK